MSQHTEIYIMAGATVGLVLCVIFGCVAWKTGNCCGINCGCCSNGGGGGYSTGSYVVQVPSANYNYTVSQSTRAYYNSNEDEEKRQKKKEEKYRKAQEIRDKYNSAEQQGRREHMAICAASGISGDFRVDKNGLLY